jgi:hypothetical protein
MRNWHSTGPNVNQGHEETDCPGVTFCPVADGNAEPPPDLTDTNALERWLNT